MDRPIRPDEAAAHKKETIPSVVIEVFNDLICENYRNGYVTILQNEVVKRLVDAGLDRTCIFDRGWLDIEGMFRAAGWQVMYDKPGYNESYEAKWVFQKS